MPPLPPNPNRDAWLADELGNFIASNLGLSVGTNFFIGELPEANVNGTPLQDGLYLIENAASLDNEEALYLDTELHFFDLWSTSSNTNSAFALLHRAYDIIERKANYALVNWYVYISYASSTIRDEGRGVEGNKLFSLAITLKCRNLNNLS